MTGSDHNKSSNKGAAPNADGRRLLAIPTPLAARVGELGLAVIRASHILCPHKQSNSSQKHQHQAFVASLPPSRPVRDFLRRFGTFYTLQLQRRLSRRFGSRLASTPHRLRHSTSGTMVL